MKKTLLALALLVGFAGTANASDMSYNFVEANYADTGNLVYSDLFQLTGWNLRGSVALGESIYMLGEYAQVSDDIGGSYIDVDIYELGAGYRHDISEKTDFFADLSYAHIKSSALGTFDYSDNGYHLRLGVRHELGDKFEGTIGVSHRDLGDYDKYTGLLLGGHYKFTENFGLVANVEAGSDTLWSVGVRASF